MANVSFVQSSFGPDPEARRLAILQAAAAIYATLPDTNTHRNRILTSVAYARQILRDIEAEDIAEEEAAKKI